MNIPFRNGLRAAFGLLLGVLLASSPLLAQLDPRLQASSTDFLDLYQQSSTAKVKPEVVTLFDFSGSMKALMFHPAYRNLDLNDSGFPGSSMTFKLTPEVLDSQQYLVTATSRMDPHVYTQMKVTVGGGTVQVTNTGEKTTDSSGSGSSIHYLYTKISNIAISPTGTVNNGTTYSLSASITLRCTKGTTTNDKLSTYVSGSGSLPLDAGINWTVTGYAGGSSNGSTSTSAITTSSNSWTSPAQAYSWVAVKNPTIKTPAVITASFNLYTAATCSELVKPDGTVVTADDAAKADSNLYGGKLGAADVRNWVRAASHARFVQNDNGVVRTLDIPIPWKVLDGNSTGNPLNSAKASDPVKSVTKLDGSTETWGSGQDIEVDRAYSIKGGSEILSGGTGTVTSTTLNHVGYHFPYLTFLFTGKYTDGPYVGKYIIYDSANASIVGGQDNASWGQGFGNGMPAGQQLMVPAYGEALNSVARPYLGNKSVDAKSYTIPARTRVQAVKEAAIKVWIKYQNDVLWAFRFLESGSGDSYMTNSSSTDLVNASLPNDTATTTGEDTAWVVLNSNSLNGMQRISFLLEGTSTPLTYAVSRSLAQFTDPYSVFNSLETGAQKASQCQNHFLIVFTDGADNQGILTNDSPYLDKKTLQGTAWEGNKAIRDYPARVNQGAGGTNYWNLYTFAAIGAHLSDTSVKDAGGTPYFKGVNSGGYPTTSDLRSGFLPYSIISRGTPSTSDYVLFDKPHRITTMTVGVSLGGTYLDPISPKYRLFAGAAIGDPTTQSWDLNKLAPFQAVPDPQDPERKVRAAGTTNFFDGSDPATLLTSLDVAIQQTTIQSNINATANPNLPFIGAALGKQIILGKFKPPQNGGAVWPGDLLMFGTRMVNGETVIVDRAANVTATLDSSTAAWSAAASMANRKWYDRTHLYTRIPGSTSVPEPGLSTFTYFGTPYDDSAVGLKKFVAPSAASDSIRQSFIQFAMGADTTGPADGTLTPPRPTDNRSSIMGDIINSGPAVLEYNFSDVSSKLTGLLGAVKGDRFRLILVGTNQGWLHAFGEVSKVVSQKDSGGKDQELVQGNVDELWSFMPTDFLANLGYLSQSGNSHRFMVDGTPTIYFLDLPFPAGGSGNGKLDKGADPDKSERAIAIFGLRKGGRSYYALDIRDPFTPALKWSLVADEAATFPSSRIENPDVSLETVQTILKNWGFSTCTPALGRVMFKGTLRDVVFLGGGASATEIEANFNGAQLGRSILALDVYTGKVLGAVDLTKIDSSAGPIPAGLVPFEFILNTGMAQRAYFLDGKGGLWAWGQKTTVSESKNPYFGYRMDSSDLSKWGLRKVSQDGSTNAVYTTVPAPFRVGAYPSPGKDGKPTPAAVGIAMVSGDRNDPLDRKGSTLSNLNRLTVVFDRQDHVAWDIADGPIVDTDLLDALAGGTGYQAGDKKITPGDPNYYLAPYNSAGAGGTTTYTKPALGYYRTFPPKTGKFVPKGINSPTVVGGSLFYSYFVPLTADVCSGGSGETYANIICDLYNPIIADTRTGLDCLSGNRFTWAGVASDYVTVNTMSVLQAGVVSVVNPQPGQSNTALQIKTITGKKPERYPKVRVWRTVH